MSSVGPSFATVGLEPGQRRAEAFAQRREALLTGLGPRMPRMEPPLWISVVGAIGLVAAVLGVVLL